MFLGVTNISTSNTSSCGCSDKCSCNKSVEYQPSEVDMYSISYSQYGSSL